MPTQFPLDFAADLAALNGLINDQELTLGRQVLTLGSAADAAADAVNFVTIEFHLAARAMQRLSVVQVPAGATGAEMDAAVAAGNADDVTNIKNNYLAFIANLLDTNDVLYRSEVFVGPAPTPAKIEVVLLRALTAAQIAALKSGGASPAGIGAPGQILVGGAGWSWTAQVVGNDIVVNGAKTTAFGGDNDKGDNGQTACGFPTRGHPNLMGCALPLGGYAHSAADHAALDGTPLPHMDFGLTSLGADRPSGAHVEVTDPKTGNKVTVPVIDLGPAKSTGHALDLTVATARMFNSNATSNNFSAVLNYRIINGAAALPGGAPAAVAAPALAAAKPAAAKAGGGKPKAGNS